MTVGAPSTVVSGIPTQPSAHGVAVATGATDVDENGGLPLVITDAQGRTYTLQQDPITGHPQYRHTTEQRDQAGSTLSLEILIDLAADGSFTRRTTQQLNLASGDNQREVVLASYDPTGQQIGEQVDSKSKEGATTTTEKTTGTFAAGKMVRRETDVDQLQVQTDPKTREKYTIAAKIHGTWDNGGKPITETTIPVVERNETQKIESPGEGINKDTDRVLTFTAHAAGPVNALDWDDNGKLIVRFDGHKGQYIERELKVPLDQANGNPKMDQAEVVRTDDKQNLLNKSLMQARIWGGLVSNLAWFAGVNVGRGSGALGKGFLGVSAAGAGAEFTGEAHAVATKRNDGDVARLAMSAYDLLLTGMLTSYMRNLEKKTSELSPSQLLNRKLTNSQAPGVAGVGINLSEMRTPLGAEGLNPGTNDAKLGLDLLPRATSQLDGDWRAVPRFDAAAALTSG